MAEGEANNKSTILDYLNEDCWRSVLQYVPVKDVILSERVSLRWQREVLVYLRGIRIGIDHRYYRTYRDRRNVSKVTMTSADRLSFNSWTNKLGPSVVDVYCDNEDSLKVVGENCPNLEGLTIMDIPVDHLKKNKYENFRSLQRICFLDHWQGVVEAQNSNDMRDRIISKFIAQENLQELEFDDLDGVTGQCLINLKSTNLKTLIFMSCRDLVTLELLRAVNQLKGLTKLVFVCPTTIMDNHMPALLANLPNLEHLTIHTYNITVNHIFEPICKLSSLKYLKLNIRITDEDLEAIARSCKELRSLLLRTCYGECGNWGQNVTGRGLAALCEHAGARLTGLVVEQNSNISDDDVVACIRACPNLTGLDVRRCSRLTEGLWPRARAARRQLGARTPLQLYVYDTRLQIIDDFEEHDGVVLSKVFSGLWHM